jgi:FtsH-binding integral membrane protein
MQDEDMTYEDKKRVVNITGIGSWIIMGLATIGIFAIVNFFIQVNSVH